MLIHAELWQVAHPYEVRLQTSHFELIFRCVQLCLLWSSQCHTTHTTSKLTRWSVIINRNLASILCCFVGKDHTSWDRHVYELM